MSDALKHFATFFAVLLALVLLAAFMGTDLTRTVAVTALYLSLFSVARR